jgi:hypothetical protein
MVSQSGGGFGLDATLARMKDRLYIPRSDIKLTSNEKLKFNFTLHLYCNFEGAKSCKDQRLHWCQIAFSKVGMIHLTEVKLLEHQCTISRSWECSANENSTGVCRRI